jgi:hypothetical protein
MTANILKITPCHFLVQYPIATKIIPPKEKCASNSGDPMLVENEKFSKVIIAYSIIFATPSL